MRCIASQSTKCYTGTVDSVDPMIEFRLAHLIVEKNIKAKDLAIAIGVTPRSISRLKNRRHPKLIDTEILDKLCKALGCQPGDLIKYKEDE